MKRITIEIPDGYDDVVSITAVGSETKSETCRRTNLMTKIADITEHGGDVLVLVEKGDIEWRKPETGWIPVAERLPENYVPVNIVWTNHNPESYYSHIKDKQFTATGVCHNGKWYWYSCVCVDYLQEYGKCEVDEVDEAIEILFWMPLPEPPEGV